MKNKTIILVIGIIIGTLILVQIFAFGNTFQTYSPTSTSSTNVETIQQKNMMVKTAIYHVLSFIKH